MAEERVESKGHFEMLWDCESCGTKGLLGKSQRNCGNCGAAQDPNKRYFPKEGEEKKVDGHVFEGADKNCQHCNAPMSGKANNCTSCGAPMTGTETVKKVAATAPPPAKKPFPVLYVVVGIILIGGLIWWRCIRTKDATMTVTGHTWERSIAVMIFGEVQKTAWRDQLPPDAASVSCHQAKRDTKQIPDGESCSDEKADKGDGTFEIVKKCKPKFRSEDVMGEECNFIVMDWKADKPVTLSGTGLDAKWPTMDVPPAEAPRTPGSKKAGAKTQKYVLQFGSQTCDELDETVWRRYNDGQAAKVEVRASSGKIVCTSL